MNGLFQRNPEARDNGTVFFNFECPHETRAHIPNASTKLLSKPFKRSLIVTLFFSVEIQFQKRV